MTGLPRHARAALPGGSVRDAVRAAVVTDWIVEADDCLSNFRRRRRPHTGDHAIGTGNGARGHRIPPSPGTGTVRRALAWLNNASARASCRSVHGQQSAARCRRLV